MAVAVLPLLTIGKLIAQLILIKKGEMLHLLGFYLKRLFGLSVISFWQNSSGLKKWLGTPLFFLRETFKRVCGLLVGNDFIASITNNAELLFGKRITTSVRLTALAKLYLHLLTAPIQIALSYPRRIIGAFLYSIILPAGYFTIPSFQPSALQPSKKYFLPNYLDGTSIETHEIISQSQDRKAPTSYIIRLQGNGGTIHREDSDETRTYYEKTRANIIFYNPRGVQQSSGLATSAWDIVSDGITQVKALLARGVKDITLDGHSLGGATATLVAEYFQQRGITIKVYNDRSFYKIGAFFLYPRGGAFTPDDKRKTDATFIGVWLRSILRWTQCEMHAGRAALSLKPEAIAVAVTPKDNVIPHCTSMYSYLAHHSTADVRAKRDMVIQTPFLLHYPYLLGSTVAHNVCKSTYPDENAAHFIDFHARSIPQ